MRPAAALVALLLLVAGPPAVAAALVAPASEERVHALFRQVRCLVCQNESIDDSDAPLAADLRTLVRGEVAAGRSDADIKRALVARYGEFVLLRPRLSLGNALLWWPPFAIVAAGLAAFALRARGRREVDAPRLSEADAARLEALVATATVPPPARPTDTISRV